MLALVCSAASSSVAVTLNEPSENMVALLNKGDGAVLRGNGRGDDVFLNKADGGAVLRDIDGVESKRAL